MISTSYHIEIRGLENIEDFVSKWSLTYSYSNEKKYNNHITKVFDSKDSFIELFKWKNGTGDVIYDKKMDVVLGFWNKVDVLRKLREEYTWDREFNWELFESEFQPQRSSTIWKLFLLHLINVHRFPIFDQHVYRSYHFFKTGKIEEVPTQSKLKYEIYKLEYKIWFNNIQQQYNIDPKMMDQSFFSFGKMLKGISSYPIKVCINK